MLSVPVSIFQPKFLSKKEREELAKKEAEDAAQLAKAKCAALPGRRQCLPARLGGALRRRTPRVQRSLGASCGAAGRRAPAAGRQAA